jgi:hypothetical protein
VAEGAQLAPASDGTVDVWWARRQDASPRYAGLLDEVERRRWQAYRREADRDRFLVGCALAKTVLAGYTGLPPEQVSFDRTCRRCGEPHGKPAIRGGGIEHSVSHSGDLIAVAVARSAVGVDVEQADGRARPVGGDGDPEQLGRLVLADDERAALAAADPAIRALACSPGPTRRPRRMCPCSTWMCGRDTWRRSRSSAAAPGCGLATGRRCWPSPRDAREAL